MKMRKYPTNYAFVVVVECSKFKVKRISKYANNYGNKYPNRFEAEKIADIRNEKHIERLRNKLKTK